MGIGGQVRTHEGHRVNVKVTGAKWQKYLFPQCKTSISHNYGSIKHRAMKSACSKDLRLWRIEWCDRHLCYVTGSDHA